MKMYPMSLWESMESSGEVSIRELFDNPDYDIDGASSKLDVPELIRAACRGGWPATLQMSQKSAMLVAKDYVNSVCENDISTNLNLLSAWLYTFNVLSFILWKAARIDSQTT